MAFPARHISDLFVTPSRSGWDSFDPPPPTLQYHFLNQIINNYGLLVQELYGL